MEVTRIFDLLSKYEKEFKPKEDVLAGKENGEWVKYNLKTYRKMADSISLGLLELGIKKGDKIATIANNRPEWNFIDMGIMQAGAIHVPIYPTISEDDYRYILKHAEAANARVTLSFSYPNIVLRITDNGKGFDMQKRLTAMDSRKRMGLRSMEERAKLLGGAMTIKSKPKQGTGILITIPHREKDHG